MPNSATFMNVLVTFDSYTSDSYDSSTRLYSSRNGGGVARHAATFAAGSPGNTNDASTSSAMSGVALVDDAQALQREPGLVVLDRLRVRQDQLGETAGGDHRRRSQLALEAVHDGVDLSAVAVDRAGLDRLDRRLPDDVLRRDQLHAAQRGGALEQRIHRDLDPGEDRAPQVLTLRAHRVDGVGGAEVDDDRGPTEQVVRTDRIGDAIGADVLGLVVEDRHAGADARLHHHRLVAEVTLGHRAQRSRDTRDAGGDGDARHVRVKREPMEAEQLLEHERELVGRAIGGGGDPPVVDELVVGEEPDHGLGVATVDGEQHVSAPLVWSRGAGRTRGRGPAPTA